MRPGDKPKKNIYIKMTNYFLTKEFVKRNVNVVQITSQEAKRTSRADY